MSLIPILTGAKIEDACMDTDDYSSFQLWSLLDRSSGQAVQTTLPYSIQVDNVFPIRIYIVVLV